MVEEITNGQTIGYSYNANGDLIEKTTGEQYSYDIQDNLTAITGNGIDKEYTYNGNGNRLSETTNSETVYYLNDVNRAYEQVLQTYNDDGVIDTYTYGLQRIDSKGEINETYLYDGRGSVVGSVSEDVMTSYAYTAYGDLMPDSPTPTVFGYNAEATDYSTGLQYLRARYYDTGVQRFVQEDDYRGDFTEPQTMNRYIYVGSNPANRVDPSGYGWLKNQISKIVDTVSSTVKNIFTTKNTATTTKNAVSKRIRNASKVSSATKIIDKSEYNYQLWLEDQGLSDKEKMEKHDPFLNDTVTTEEYLQNKDIRRNTKIVPTTLEYGKAGYINGEYCNDGGQAKKQDLMQKGVPEYIVNTIIPTIFTPMSESEVQGRNEAMERAYEYINVTWETEEKLTGYKSSDGDIEEYKAGIYRGVPYWQRNTVDSADDFKDLITNGSFSKGSTIIAGADCSSFWSDVVNNVDDEGVLHRTTTGPILEFIKYHKQAPYPYPIVDEQGKIIGDRNIYVDITATTNFARLAPGDSIVKNGHIRVVVDNKDGVITFMEQSTSGESGGTNISTATYKELEDIYTGMIIDYQTERNRAGG